MGKKKENGRPNCPFNKFDCFAMMSGNRCWCLDSTDFKPGQECPFYKKEEDVDHVWVMKKYKEEAQGC